MHEGDVFVRGGVRDDEVDVATVLGEGARKIKAGDT